MQPKYESLTGVAAPKGLPDPPVKQHVGTDTGDVATAMAVAADRRPRRLQENQKKILFVTRAFQYGGAERHLLELIRRLGGPEVQLSILCLQTDYYFYSERLNQDPTAAYVDIIRNRELDSKSRLAGLWNWFQVLRDARPDVVVFVNGVLWSFPWYAIVAGWLARIPRRFSIAHLPPPPVPEKVEGWSIRTVGRRLRRAKDFLGLRLSASFSHATICVSNEIRASLVRDYRFPASRTITIHNGVSLPEFDCSEGSGLALRTRLGLSPEEFLLVCTARLSEQKGIDILLLAMARVLHDGVRCKCIIVGDGPLRRQLLEQALALGLSGHVFFEGFQEDVRPYLQAGDAFVLTSHKEGLPLAILEAMACGLPCVVTNVGGNAEVVTHGVHGLVVPPGSAKDVTDAISYLVAHSQERLHMSKMARARVCEAFDIEDRMAEIKRVILS